MKLKDVFDWFIPDFISDLFKKEEGWKHKGTIGVKQYAEHIPVLCSSCTKISSA